jgi:hypothetical protein
MTVSPRALGAKRGRTENRLSRALSVMTPVARPSRSLDVTEWNWQIAFVTAVVNTDAS